VLVVVLVLESNRWEKLLERIQPGKEILVRIVAMLTKLVERFGPRQYRVRESAQA